MWIDNSTVSYQLFINKFAIERHVYEEMRGFMRYYARYDHEALTKPFVMQLSYFGLQSIGPVEEAGYGRTIACGVGSLNSMIEDLWFFLHCAMPLLEAVVVCEKEIENKTSRLPFSKLTKECPVYFVYLRTEDSYWCVRLGSQLSVGNYQTIPTNVLGHNMLNIYLTSWSRKNLRRFCVNCKPPPCQCMSTSGLQHQQIKNWFIIKSKNITNPKLSFARPANICSQMNVMFCKHLHGTLKLYFCQENILRCY